MQNERNVKSYKVFLFVCFFTSALLCKAQTDKVSQEELEKYYPKRMVNRVELLAGPSYVYGRGSNLFNSYRVFKLGFAGGIGLVKNISPKFGIRMSFMFETKGYTQSIHATNMDSGYARPARLVEDVTLNYLTFQVLPKYYFMKGRVSIGIGPYIGYLNSFKYEQDNYVNGTLAISYTRRKMPYEVFKKYDYGVIANAGVNFNRRASLDWSLNIQYSLGLIDINQPSVIGLTRNNVYSLLIALKIKDYEKFNYD